MRALLPLLLLAAPALADVPALDSAATCAQVAEQLGDAALEARCLADEAAALLRLRVGWDAVPADIAGGCAALATDAGAPGSTQILLLCVEDRLAAQGQPSPFPPPEAP